MIWVRLVAADRHPRQLRQLGVQGAELGAHLGLELGDEHLHVARLVQLVVILRVPDLEVVGQVLVGVAHSSTPTAHISLQRSCSRRAWKTHASYTVRMTRLGPLAEVKIANYIQSLRATPSSGMGLAKRQVGGGGVLVPLDQF
ncbi:hypothetical protein ACFRPV_36235 [Kitasatospora sp. NPDC056808]